MIYENFCFWLKGYLSGCDGLGKNQLLFIRDQLKELTNVNSNFISWLEGIIAVTTSGEMVQNSELLVSDIIQEKLYKELSQFNKNDTEMTEQQKEVRRRTRDAILYALHEARDGTSERLLKEVWSCDKEDICESNKELDRIIEAVSLLG